MQATRRAPGQSSASNGSTPSGDGGGGGSSGAECSAITIADAQALIPTTVTSVSDTGIGECHINFGGSDSGVTDLPVDYYLNDSALTAYNTLSGGNDHQISGIGDQAYWNEAVDTESPPQLSAHKGSVTCTIQSNAPPDTTMKTTAGGLVGYTVTDSDALAYVQLMGKICNDVLNAAQ